MQSSAPMGGWEATNQNAGAGTHVLATWLFLRLLGLIYLSAFLSLALQIRGLLGRQGILPAVELLATRRHWGAARFWTMPTLCWVSSTDAGLLFLSWAGAGLAVLLIIGVAQLPVLVLLWTFYLSLFTVGRLFLCYQWDILLLETGFLAMFLAPPQLTPSFPPSTNPPSVAIWLIWWLLFRLMFWSGAVKLRSGDAAWQKLLALKYHYETQPLPTRLAWYAHQLPLVFHKFSTAAVLGIELGAPLLILSNYPGRYAAAALISILMILIQLTGNYAFFNLLGIALSVPLLDDRVLLPLFHAIFPNGLQFFPASSVSNACAWLAASLVLILSLDPIANLLRLQITWPQALARFLDVIEPFRLVNSYGLFAIMTTWRPEIIVEGSNDGRTWQAYEFKCKPGQLNRPPRFVAPHQPRLDWQMWFAALGAQPSNTWFERFRERLMEGSPATLSLLRTNPFPDYPPKYVRGVLYDYRFSNWAERRATGVFWIRERKKIFRP